MKNVLITGAAHGLGKALASRFLDGGWFVIATDVDDLSLAWLTGRQNALALRMDVSSDESVAGAFRTIQRNGTVIDLVINNAGVDRYFPLSEAAVEEFKSIFEVNLFGPYRVNQVFLPLIRRPGGRILLIGSESFQLTLPFMPYPITKRALEGYGKALRMELRYLAIDVVIIRPGAIRTRLIDNLATLDTGKATGELGLPFRIFAGKASREVGRTRSPGEVADFIFRVAGTRKPRAVYRINNMVKLRLTAMLPFSWVERAVHRMLE